jgi:parallel beta-helix repeat protein
LSAAAGTQFANFARGNPLETPPPPPPIVHIYIRNDGSVDPSSASIQRTGNVYTLMDDLLNSTIEVQRDNVVIDGAGFILQGHSPYEGLTLIDRSNVMIMNLDIRQSRKGIEMQDSSNNIITRNRFAISYIAIEVIKGENNTVSENHFEGAEILLFNTSRNIVSKNIMSNGSGGISIETCSSENSVFGNNVTGQTQAGIEISRSRGNSIYQNFLENNKVGIYIDYASLDVFVTGGNITINTFRQNDLMNNTASVYTEESPNIPSSIQHDPKLRMELCFEGNFWSDYNGTDNNKDGIGDTPYVINSDNVDNYPLMAPFDINNNATVVPTPTPSPTLKQSEPSSTILVAAASVASAIIIGAGLVAYFKKHKH